MPLAAAAERVVLAEGIGGEFLGHQDPPQVGVAAEADAVHVVDLALHPVGARPEGDDRGQRRIGLVDARLDDEPLGRVEVEQHVMDLEPGRVRPGIAEIVGRAQLGEQREAALAL